MERYCFYCGKKLMPGERCDCRYAQKRQQNPVDKVDTAEASQVQVEQNDYGHETRSEASDHRCKKPTDSSAGRQTKEERRSSFNHFFEQRNSRRSKRKQRRRKNRKHHQSWQSQTRPFWSQGHGTGRPIRQYSFLRLLPRLASQPSVAIAEGAGYPISRLIILQVLEALLYFSLGFRLLSNTNLGNWLVFASLRSDNKLNMTSIYLFIALVAVLLSALGVCARGASYKLVAHCSKFLHSQPLKAHFKALIPGSLYYLIFLLLANGFSFGTGTVGAAMLLVGLSTRFLVDFKSQKELLKIQTDQFFWQAILALVIQFVCLAFLFQLLLPNVFSFNFHPLI